MSVVLLALLDYAATAIDSEALADWVGETAREAIEAAGATTLLALMHSGILVRALPERGKTRG